MIFTIEVHSWAIADRDEIYAHIGEDSGEAPERVYQRLKAAILGLAQLPKRCPVAFSIDKDIRGDATAGRGKLQDYFFNHRRRRPYLAGGSFVEANVDARRAKLIA